MSELPISMDDSKVAPVEAQADQPVAWMYTRAEDGRKVLDFAPNPNSAGTWEPLFTRPTPAAVDLHQQIMNIPVGTPGWSGNDLLLYKEGHRDARHAAAQLVAASPAAAAPQQQEPVVFTEEDYQAIADASDQFLLGKLKAAIDSRLAEKQQCK